jgi:hypothetical protein
MFVDQSGESVAASKVKVGRWGGLGEWSEGTVNFMICVAGMIDGLLLG